LQLLAKEGKAAKHPRTTKVGGAVNDELWCMAREKVSLIGTYDVLSASAEMLLMRKAMRQQYWAAGWKRYVTELPIFTPGCLNIRIKAYWTVEANWPTWSNLVAFSRPRSGGKKPIKMFLDPLQLFLSFQPFNL
jgi:hypothetical protein